MQDSVSSISISPSVQSDHSAIVLKISPVKEHIKGASYWKFNNSLLNDKDFVSQMKIKIPEFYQEAIELSNPNARWDYKKYQIRQFSWKISKEKAKQRKAKRIGLESRIKELKSSISIKSDSALINEYNECKQELEILYDYITQGIILRSKTTWYEHGEKSTKYFLNLEKRNKAKTHVRKILLQNNLETTEPKAIMSTLKTFYSNLYKRTSTKTENECQQYLKDIPAPKLHENDKQSCEREITKNECWDALKSMGNNKSPGIDGLTKEFYLAFFAELQDYLLQSINFSFHNGQLSNSQRQATITLIEKKDRDKRLLKNWRPISLINVDAKIISKVLALRIKHIMHTLIHHDQTAYVKNRFIGESIRLIDDILDYADDNDIPGILFSADFEKAFDSIDHSFMFAVLEKFGFGPNFIHWIRTLYNGAESSVMNNGHSTGFFTLERGTRLGDPISAYLFILALEILFLQVRQNIDIQGFMIDGHEIKISGYADDAKFLTINVHSMELVLAICDTFQEFSSLKLNKEKSEACWIGSKKHDKDKPLNCRWINLTDDKICSLGVYHSYDPVIASKHNFLDLVQKLRECLQVWKLRSLSLAGKILVFNTLALSKSIYVATMIAPPKQFIDEANRVQKEFIWDKKRSKIKHCT